MKKSLYKSVIIIWSDTNPNKMELSDLARDAESGDSYCSQMKTSLIKDPVNDPDWDGTEFFEDNLSFDEEA